MENLAKNSLHLYGKEAETIAKKRGRKPKIQPAFMYAENPAKEIEKRAGAYFTECEGTPLFETDPNTGEEMPVLDKNKNVVVLGAKPPTLSGLALALGFTGRKQMLSCRLKSEEQQIALLCEIGRVEAYAEARLYNKETMQGAKFMLVNNFAGWKEKETEAEATGKKETEQVPFEVVIKVV